MNSSFSFSRPPRKTGGFTLLEMMITLGIFLILSGAVFGIIIVVLQSASTLQDNLNRGDSSVALGAFLKKKFEDLPAQSDLMSYRRGDGEGLAQNGIIFGHDKELMAIDAKPQANGLYTLRVTTYDPGIMPANTVTSPLTNMLNAVTGDDARMVWISLIRDIKTLSWKFQDQNGTQWVDLWNESAIRPKLIEFSMQQAGDLEPATMDYWLPPLDAPTLMVPPPTTSPNGTSQNGAPQAPTPATNPGTSPHVH